MEHSKRNWIIKILLIIAATVVMFFAGSKFLTIMERERAQRNAISYIEKKYGFTPEIVSGERYYELDFDFNLFISYSKNPTDNYRFRMLHEGEYFTVYIPYKFVTDEGRDNYQDHEIDDAVNDAVASYFDGKALAVNKDKDNRIRYEYVESEYYDGTNIEKFYREGESYYVYTVGCDLDSIDLDHILKETNGDSIYVFDCKSEEAFENMYGQNPFEILWPETDGIAIDSFLPCLDEFAIQNADEKRYYAKVDLKEGEGFLYCPVNTDGKVAIYVPKDGSAKNEKAHDYSINDYYYMYYVSDDELKDFKLTIDGG